MSTIALVKRDLILTRSFNAPRELVFRLWTDPKHLAQWWGPKCFTNPVCDVNAKFGGMLRIVMRGPNGVEHMISGIFQEVEPPERLVFTNNVTDKNGNILIEGLTTVTFEEAAGRTKIKLITSAAGSAATAAAMMKGMDAGWSQSLDKLQEQVTTASVAERGIMVTRVLDAPRALVFRVWTDPKHVIHWWGPNAFTNTIHEMSVKPGGVWRLTMHGPDGTDYPNRIVYSEVVKNERLVYSHGDEDDPDQFEVTVTFDEQEEKTRLTMQMVCRTAAERDKLIARFHADEGATQMMERLKQYLSTES